MAILRLGNEHMDEHIDLLSGAFGLSNGFDASTPDISGMFTYEPYGAQFDPSNFEPRTEVFNLTIKGRPASVIAESQRLQNFVENIRLYGDADIAIQSSWLEWSACDEEPKRSFLYSGTWQVTSRDNVTPDLRNMVIEGVLTLTRHPLWEDAITYASKERPEAFFIDRSVIGGIGLIDNMPGNTLARIANTWLRANVVGMGPYYRYWVGIRRENQGRANFHPVWETEDGTPGTDCAAGAVDPTASPEQLGAGLGRSNLVTYVTTTLASRLTITVNQVCTAYGDVDYDHQQGRYLVLLRCKLSAAGVNGVQMRWGYTGNHIEEEVYIDNTNWRLIPVGNISIPPWQGEQTSAGTYMREFRIDIYAEQITTGNLYLDCLILIPNEHLLTVEGGASTYTIADVARTMEDDREYGFEIDINTYILSDSVAFTMNDWYIPPGDSVMVMAAEDQNNSDVLDEMAIIYSWWPRWTLYRGE